ncbi:glycosyltransferase family 4 protein [Paenibacillus sp. 481]|nr:glycosyltransferase family 4 protein [Paenibacillus sp. 481]
MNILFTYYVPSGGVETLNRLRCQTLNRNGINGHLLYLRSGAGIQNVSNIPMFTTNYDEDIKQILEHHQYALIFVSSDYTMIERLRRLGYNGPIVYEAQGLGPLHVAENTIIEAAPVLKQYAQAVHLPPTRHLISLFGRHCPWLPQYVFSNVIDTARFNYKPNIPPVHPIVAWVGRLEENKNWKDFLEIGYWLNRYDKRVRLWMFQDANIYVEADKQLFEPMIKALNLQDKLTIFNNVPHAEMAHYFSQIGDSGGILLSTSGTEGFGYAVAEAMTCRCPVLCTDSDGVKLFVRHDVTGKFYGHHQISQAVEQALDLMRNKPLRNQIRETSASYIKAHFGESEYVYNFKNMLRSVLGIGHL